MWQEETILWDWHKTTEAMCLSTMLKIKKEENIFSPSKSGNPTTNLFSDFFENFIID